MVNNKHEWVRTNHVSNLRGIQNSISETIHEFQLIKNNNGKITELKTRKNEDIKVRNQGGYVDVSNNVRKLSNKDSSLSESVFKRLRSSHISQFGQNKEWIKRRNDRLILTSSHDSN